MGADRDVFNRKLKPGDLIMISYTHGNLLPAIIMDKTYYGFIIQRTFWNQMAGKYQLIRKWQGNTVPERMVLYPDMPEQPKKVLLDFYNTSEEIEKTTKQV